MGVDSQEWVVVGRSAVAMLSSSQLEEEGHQLLGHKQRVIRTEEVYMVYTNRMLEPCKDIMEILVFMLSQFLPVKDNLRERKGTGGRCWLRQEQDQEWEWEKNYSIPLPILAKLLCKLVKKKEVSEHCEKEMVKDALNKEDLGELENTLLELVCVNSDVKRKESVSEEISLDYQPVLVPDMVEAVQEFMDMLIGSLSEKLVEAVISLAMAVLSYLSGMQSNPTLNVEVSNQPAIFTTEMQLDRDIFIYSPELFCWRLEDVEPFQCTTTKVSMWSYIIFSLLCPLYGLELTPGKLYHVEEMLLDIHKTYTNESMDKVEKEWCLNETRWVKIHMAEGFYNIIFEG